MIEVQSCKFYTINPSHLPPLLQLAIYVLELSERIIKGIHLYTLEESVTELEKRK